MEKFASGLCMGNFALSVLCKVLMDMIYSKLDFISETKLLEWETVKDLMKSSLGLGFILDCLRKLVNDRERSLSLSLISSNLSPHFPTPDA